MERENYNDSINKGEFTMKTIKEILTESNGVLKLAVHNGVFHADDVLCVAMIKNKLKELGLSREVEIIRSRNPETLAKLTLSWMLVVVSMTIIPQTILCKKMEY